MHTIMYTSLFRTAFRKTLSYYHDARNFVTYLKAVVHLIDRCNYELAEHHPFCDQLNSFQHTEHPVVFGKSQPRPNINAAA